jgi:hypothetical protein
MMRAVLDRHHGGLPWFIRTLPETVTGATRQREHERKDSDDTHDLISSTNSIIADHCF